MQQWVLSVSAVLSTKRKQFHWRKGNGPFLVARTRAREREKKTDHRQQYYCLDKRELNAKGEEWVRESFFAGGQLVRLLCVVSSLVIVYARKGVKSERSRKEIERRCNQRKKETAWINTEWGSLLSLQLFFALNMIESGADCWRKRRRGMKTNQNNQSICPSNQLIISSINLLLPILFSLFFFSFSSVRSFVLPSMYFSRFQE